MEKIVRRGAFETNSSSTHSITISVNESLDIPQVGEDGVVYIGYSDFGWEEDRHNDFLTKASYLAIYIRDWTGAEVDWGTKEVSNLSKYHKYREIFERVIKSNTGCLNIAYEDSFIDKEKIPSWDNGYIDHQSVKINKR